MQADGARYAVELLAPQHLPTRGRGRPQRGASDLSDLDEKFLLDVLPKIVRPNGDIDANALGKQIKKKMGERQLQDRERQFTLSD